MDVSMYHYDAVDSTNTQCRRLAAEGVVNAVVTADCQTAGRGRMGRSFQSPPGLGLYLSVLWRTGLRTDTLPMVTPLGQRPAAGRQKGLRHPDGIRLPARRYAGLGHRGHRRQCLPDRRRFLPRRSRHRYLSADGAEGRCIP